MIAFDTAAAGVLCLLASGIVPLLRSASSALNLCSFRSPAEEAAGRAIWIGAILLFFAVPASAALLRGQPSAAAAVIGAVLWSTVVFTTWFEDVLSIAGAEWNSLVLAASSFLAWESAGSLAHFVRVRKWLRVSVAGLSLGFGLVVIVAGTWAPLYFE
ncbi:MAG: hypothetical protein KY475_13370 [Planctomycetes bacterium]|nr:hypothetical protein [Planctomycetota bacterium]